MSTIVSDPFIPADSFIAHTVDYMRWEGTDRDFIKIIATPKIKVRARSEAS